MFKKLLENTYLKWIWLFLAIVPVFQYFRLFFANVQNIPHWDDYAIIRTIDKIKKQSFLEALGSFFAQHNEHRIAITRFFAAIIHSILGYLDFRVLAFCGNLFLIGIAWIFWKYYKSKSISFWYFLPVLPLLFQLKLWENTYWGMASVQNFGVVFFILFSFWFIYQNKMPFITSVLAVFTSGNAIVFLPLLGTIKLLFEKQWKQLKVWVPFCLVLFFLYFFNYQKPADLVGLNFKEIVTKASGFAAMLGSVADIGTGLRFETIYSSAVITGLIVTMITVFFLGYNYLKTRTLDWFLVSILLFVFGSAIVVAFTRYNFGNYVFLVGRYKIYSILLCIVAYTYLIQFLTDKKKSALVILSLLVLFVAFLCSNFYNQLAIKTYQYAELASFYNGWHNDKNEIVSNAKGSCFSYEKGILDRQITKTEGFPEKLYFTKIINDSLNHKLIFESDIVFDLGKNGAGTPFLLVKGKRNYIFANSRLQNTSKKQFYLGQKPAFQYGFKAEIPLTEVESDAYILDILWVGEKTNILYKTNYYQEMKGIKTKEPNVNWEH